MRKERIVSPHVAEPPPGLYSNCFRVGDAVYISGLTAWTADGIVGANDEYEQARFVFGKIRHFIEAAGGTMDDIVKLTTFVTRIGESAGIRRARAEFFTGDFPASSMVEVSRLARPEILLEIEAIGYVGCSTGP